MSNPGVYFLKLYDGVGDHDLNMNISNLMAMTSEHLLEVEKMFESIWPPHVGHSLYHNSKTTDTLTISAY